MSNPSENGVNGGVNVAKTSKDETGGVKMEEKEVKVTENVSKVAEMIVNPTKTEQKTDKKRRIVTKNVQKPATQNTTTNKGGDIMADRKNAEAICIKVAKEIGGFSANRVQARDNAKGPGALQFRRADGLKLSVRVMDVMCLSPYEVIKVGKSAGGGYPHITLVRFNDPNLETAVRRCFKDKKSNLSWAAELKASRRTKTVEDLAARKKRLQEELKAISAVETKLKKKAERAKRVKPEAAAEPTVA